MKSGKKMKILNLTIDDETNDIVKKLRSELSLNISELIRRLLKEYYENNAVNKV